MKAYTFLNLASLEVLNKFDTFDFKQDEDREDVLVQKFEQLCLPVKNGIMDRHAFNTTNQKQHESIQCYVSTLKVMVKKCGALHDELIRDHLPVQFNPCTNCRGQHAPERNKCPGFNKCCNTCGKLNQF